MEQNSPAVQGPPDEGVRRPSLKSSGLRVACILEQQTYKPGDQAPDGYLAWHEWAEAQHKAGLRQKQCGKCGLWRYPQELSNKTVKWQGLTKSGSRVQKMTLLCLKCTLQRRGNNGHDLDFDSCNAGR